MSFDWMKFLHLSDELVQSGSQPVLDEAKLRSAVSRAYYAVYHIANDYLRNQGKNPISVGSHADTYKAFLEFQDSNRQSIGHSLKRLRECRNTADYADVVSHKSAIKFSQPKTIEKCLLESKATIEQILKLKRRQP